jgi:hypothetical protein
MNSKALRKAYFANKENDSPNRDNGFDSHNEVESSYKDGEYEDYWDELYDEGVREAQMDKIRRSNKRNRKEDR